MRRLVFLALFATGCIPTYGPAVITNTAPLVLPSPVLDAAIINSLGSAAGSADLVQVSLQSATTYIGAAPAIPLPSPSP